RNVIRQKLAKGEYYIRHLSKPAYREEFKGDTERSTAAYTSVRGEALLRGPVKPTVSSHGVTQWVLPVHATMPREDSSLGSTYKLPLEVEFGKMSKAEIILQQLKTNKLIEDKFKPELILAVAE
ncbi:MAG: palindromic element RPE1 domain-containing protein, partial [Candidatus Midichloria mitochondrii]|nr:palindromic element RPE1 domain-containing protein [Candidatus Midichloria mitochondrii]